MADTNRTGLNLLKYHIKEECSSINIKVEEVNEEIIKTETEICGGSWVNQYVDIHELLANENQNLENSEGKLLNENAGLKNEAFEDDSTICEKINNLSTNHQKDNENGLWTVDVDFDNVSMDFDREEKVSQHDLDENTKINNKKEKEKSKFLHDDNDYLSTGTLKKRLLMSQKKCEEDVVSNHGKGKKRKSERNAYYTTEKKNKCTECSYATVSKCALLCHIRSRHTMEKPYKCNECSYAAVRKRNLLIHIQSHHLMEKPYKCKECSYAAVEKRTLLSHIKSCHTMEKPYKCNECSYAAVRKADVVSHIKCRHTMKESYKCNECSYEAPRKSGLVVHIKCCHTIQKPPNLQTLRMFL